MGPKDQQKRDYKTGDAELLLNPRAVWVFFSLQIREKEEDELNEKSENDSGINEEPLLTADQVLVLPLAFPRWKF